MSTPINSPTEAFGASIGSGDVAIQPWLGANSTSRRDTDEFSICVAIAPASKSFQIKGNTKTSEESPDPKRCVSRGCRNYSPFCPASMTHNICCGAHSKWIKVYNYCGRSPFSYVRTLPSLHFPFVASTSKLLSEVNRI